MALLSSLNRFYQNEKAGLPHEKAEVWQLGWQLAEIVEIYGLDAWKGISPDEEAELVEILRCGPDSAVIDTAVNLLHWALLHSQGEEPDWEAQFNQLGRDVIIYILNRNSEDASG